MFPAVLWLPVELLKSTATASVPEDTAVGGVAIWNGTVYLSDVNKNAVMARDPGNESFSEFLRDARIPAPRGLAVDGDFLYIADPIAQQVFRVNTHSKEISPLLPPDSEIRPIDLVSVPEFLRDGEKLTRLSSLAIIDANTKSVVLWPRSTNNHSDSASTSFKFRDPRSISQFYDKLLVADSGSASLFLSSVSGFAESSWFDIRALATPGVVPSLDPEEVTGTSFPTMLHPESAYGYSDFVYVIDNQRPFAYLPAKNRLVPLAFSKVPLAKPQRVIVNVTTGELLFTGRSVQDYRAWPIVVPMSVEVEPSDHASTPLAALYEYLWQRGTLPLTTVQMPAMASSGKPCVDPICLIEQVRFLLPKANKEIETLLCQLNPNLCSNNKILAFRPATSIVVPDVPFEPYLFPEIRKFDGKATIRSVVNKMIMDQRLLHLVNDAYLKSLNPKSSLTLDSIPQSHEEVLLPRQRTIYYLSIDKSEIVSSNSGLAKLVNHYPNLSIRPYGTSSVYGIQSGLGTEKNAVQATAESSGPTTSFPAQTVATQAQPAIPLRNVSELKSLEEELLANMGFNENNATMYGTASDVPVLIADNPPECRHPAFFGVGLDNRAFMGSECATPKLTTAPIFVGWTETDSHHATCVASIIAGRSSAIPYHSSLASGADLSRKDLTEIETRKTLYATYSSEGRPFVVNISAGDPDAFAEQRWRDLLQENFIRDHFFFVASAGNDHYPLDNQVKNIPASLAREFPNMISVGALNKTGKDIWKSSDKLGSNYGPKVEILAPGEDVPCALEVSADQAVYSAASATSFAAPLVSAVGALLLGKQLTPVEVKARILATADPMGRDQEGLAVFGKVNVDYALLKKLSRL